MNFTSSNFTLNETFKYSGSGTIVNIEDTIRQVCDHYNNIHYYSVISTLFVFVVMPFIATLISYAVPKEHKDNYKKYYFMLENGMQMGTLFFVFINLVFMLIQKGII